jgi:hypothetical protein
MSKISSPSDLPTDLWYSTVIIPLSSSLGQELFSTSFHVAYDCLNRNFEGQERLFFCGIACASILLNTLLPFQKWNQSTLYSTIAQSHMLNGITLSNLSHVLELCGLSSIIRYCENETVEEQFREDLKKQDNFVIVNYWRQYHVKEKDYIHRSGHFSLIGGFDEKTDNVLILDTSHTRFPHHWLPLEHLVRMMCTYDRMASMPRGYLIINQTKQIKENLILTHAE